MKKLILFASIVLASGLMLTNTYNSLIDVRSWGTNIPNSIGVAREYFSTVNPGNFFRFFSPLNQLLAFLAVVFFWKVSPHVRMFLLIAFILYVLADVFTFTYFYPRNDIMFKGDITAVEKIRLAWKGWNIMNWLRTLIIVAGIVFSFLALNRIYLSK